MSAFTVSESIKPCDVISIMKVPRDLASSKDVQRLWEYLISFVANSDEEGIYLYLYIISQQQCKVHIYNYILTFQ